MTKNSQTKIKEIAQKVRNKIAKAALVGATGAVIGGGLGYHAASNSAENSDKEVEKITAVEKNNPKKITSTDESGNDTLRGIVQEYYSPRIEPVDHGDSVLVSWEHTKIRETIVPKTEIDTTDINDLLDPTTIKRDTVTEKEVICKKSIKELREMVKRQRTIRVRSNWSNDR